MLTRILFFFCNGQSSSTLTDISFPLYSLSTPPFFFFFKLHFLTISPQQFNMDDICLTAPMILPILFYYSVIILVMKVQGVRKPLQRPPTTKPSWKMPFINIIFAFTWASQINCPLTNAWFKRKKNADNSEHYRLAKEGTSSLFILRKAISKTNNEETKYAPI